jgi:hypothetical protein
MALALAEQSLISASHGRFRRIAVSFFAMSIIDLASWLGSLGRLGVILRRYEMKDKSSRDACRERDGRAPLPIGNDAQGNYH